MYKLIRYHPRLWTSTAVGVLVFFLMPRDWPALVRLLASWNCGVALFLVLIHVWMMRLTAEQIRAHYEEEDASASVILVVVTVAALLSLIAIVALLSSSRQAGASDPVLHIGLAALTIVDSWLLVATMFMLHYAVMYYRAAPPAAPLTFPKTSEPVFWDFAYFSLTIAAACQTSDVATTDVSIRKVVIAQTLISFLFNVSILGFAINVSAGLVAG